MKTENRNIAITTVANRLAFIPPTDRVRRILKNPETILPSQGLYARHIAALPCKVNRNYNFWQDAFARLPQRVFWTTLTN